MTINRRQFLPALAIPYLCALPIPKLNFAEIDGHPVEMFCFATDKYKRQVRCWFRVVGSEKKRIRATRTGLLYSPDNIPLLGPQDHTLLVTNDIRENRDLWAIGYLIKK